MKKVFFSVVIAAAMTVAMGSCNKGPQCWEIGPKVFGAFVPTEYFYGTADEAEAYIKKEYGTSVVISKKKVSKAETECKGLIGGIDIE